MGIKYLFTTGRKTALPFILAFALTLLLGWLLFPIQEENSTELPKNNASYAEIFTKLMNNQPDYVLYAPMAHSRDNCNQCHHFDNTSYLNKLGIKEQEHIKGNASSYIYKITPQSMSECQSCHSIPAHSRSTTAGNSCGSCHK